MSLHPLELCVLLFFFFFNDTATTEIYTLSLHDALPIYRAESAKPFEREAWADGTVPARSEEHTSELQSHSDLVCRLLLEKKKRRRHHHRRAGVGLHLEDRIAVLGRALHALHAQVAALASFFF